ncbi:MAG: hypothetical protein CVV58_05710 [Tenericutes bacterium HGW-Tenericutes-3]|nr:MAG: hypothetical protein CVV58_05710 [Tenericutes bacterium HGW-Tenericutes-3]
MKKKLTFLFVMLPFVLILNGCTAAEPTLEIVKSQDTVEINSEYIDQGATFVNGVEEILVYSETTIDTSVLGLTQLNYTYTLEEETFTAIRYVIVVDQTAPMISLNMGIDTVIVGITWIDQGVTITDNSLEEITPTILGVVNTTVAGTYEIRYTATDASGNMSSITRFVTVIAQT